MANKHEAYELAQMQSLPLSAKIRMTQQRIRDWYDYWDGNVYVSISGGKDSQVLAHIVKDLYPDVPLVFVNTGLEFDSVRLKGMELADEVLRPEMSFVEVIKKYGYPVISKEVSDCITGARRYLDTNGEHGSKSRLDKILGIRKQKNGELSHYNYKKYKFLLDSPFRISSLCCDYSKKNPAKRFEHQNHYKPILGQMACESRKRKQGWIKTGCNAFDSKRPQSNPMAFWTEQDILQYIKLYKLEIAEIYGDIVYTDDDGMYYDNDLFNLDMKLTTTGAKRTGCVFCLFGITQDTDRFLKLKEAEPKKYDYVMRGGWLYYTVKDKNGNEVKLRHCTHAMIEKWCEDNAENENFAIEKNWQPHNGLGYKFVIDWLNEHGNLGIKY